MLTNTLDATIPQEIDEEEEELHSLTAPNTEKHFYRPRKMSPSPPDPMGPAQRAVLERLCTGKDEAGLTSLLKSARNVSPSRSSRGRTSRPISPSTTIRRGHSRCCQQHREEAERTKDQFHTLQRELLSLQQDVSNVKREKEQIQAEIVAAKLQRHAARTFPDEVQDLKQQVKDYQDTIKQLHGKVATHTAGLKQLKQDGLRDKEQLAELRREASARTAEAEQARQDKKATERQMLDDKNTITDLQQEIIDDQDKLSDLQGELLEWKDKVKGLELTRGGKMDEMREELQSMLQTVEKERARDKKKHEDELTEWKRKVATLEKEKQAIDGDRTRHTDDLAEWKKKALASEKEKRANDEELEEWKDKARASERKKQANDDELEEWRAKAETLRREKQANDDELEEWKAKAETLRREKQANDDELEEWKTKAETLKREKQANDDELEDWKDKASALERRKQAMEGDWARHDNELGELKDKARALEREREKVAELENDKDLLKVKIGTLEERNNQELQRSNQELEKATRRIQDLDDELAALNSGGDGGEDRLHEQIRRLQEDAVAEEDRLCDLQDELAKNKAELLELKADVVRKSEAMMEKDEMIESLQTNLRTSNHRTTLPATHGNRDAEETIADLESELNNAHEYSILLEQRQADLQAKIRRLESREASEPAVTEPIANYENEMRLENELVDVKDELVDVKEELVDVKAELVRQTDKVESLRGEIAEMLDKIENLESQRDERGEEETGENKALRDQIDDLNQQKKILGDKIAGLEAGQQDLAQLQARLRADNERMSEELSKQTARTQSPEPLSTPIQLHPGARQGSMGVDIDANTLVITRVVTGGPSANAGIKKGDKIIGVRTNDDEAMQVVECSHVLRAALSISGGVAEGSTIELTIARRGVRKSYQITLVKDDGGVAATMKRHLKMLKDEYPSLRIKHTTLLATDEGALQDALLQIFPSPDHPITLTDTHTAMESFNASIGLPIYTKSLVNYIFPSGGRHITPVELVPKLTEAFYASLRDLELGPTH
eukprot:TRINITY_DN3020_c0_g1_i1.p1 TRINITY_DN3020_c0_g1~~TRINITY_DN3020_c0_g1_i1.p1  ORF type:complete len:1027 (+),score=309.58 TRINITY_DN3020_c0_g1_i1:62-3142(+)